MNLADSSATQYAQPTAYVIVISTYFTKLSLLLLYFRIFKPNRIVYIGTIIGMVTFTIYYVIVFFLYIFVKATEIQLRFTYSVAVINVVTDVYILCLPFIGVWQLQLSAVKKRRVSAIFMTGLLYVACMSSAEQLLTCVQRCRIEYRRCRIPLGGVRRQLHQDSLASLHRKVSCNIIDICRIRLTSLAPSRLILA